MKFQILADNEKDCGQMAENLRAALKELELDLPVETHASPGLTARLNAGSPVLAEDHRVISSGKLLSAGEIADLLRSLHGSEIAGLRKTAERIKRKARVLKNLLLLIAVFSAFLTVANLIRQRKAEAAAEAAKPLVLRFSRPIKMLYLYRRPRPEDDVKFEVMLRRVAYASFPEEIKRNLFSVESQDAGSDAGAGSARKYRVRSFPAVILIRDQAFLPLVISGQDDPQQKMIQTADMLNSGSFPGQK